MSLAILPSSYRKCDIGTPTIPKAIGSLARKQADVTRQGTQKLKFVPTLPARRKKELVPFLSIYSECVNNKHSPIPSFQCRSERSAFHYSPFRWTLFTNKCHLRSLTRSQSMAEVAPVAEVQIVEAEAQSHCHVPQPR
jgi:hypothetical protein